ncbi:conserved protein of unknown function [Streptantibioticus cattleyicolor NRRL 8057 = DSM 46488]|nr:hypothetical protein [Streptomyces sp. SID5468]CCB72766.1 conserved protein of unknown function [Streptantibioticus cattleyicolor NRRL 8057 = DSM 46488]
MSSEDPTPGGTPHDDGRPHPPRPGDTEPEETLPCGRSLPHVWEYADDPTAAGPEDTAHLRDCPHCREALAGLRALDDYVRRAEGDEADGAERTLPEATRHTEGITARVMDLVRAETRPGRALALGGAADDAWIAEAAAAKVFRAAAETLPGVQAGSCRIAPADPGTAPAPATRWHRVPPGPLRVALDVVVSPRWTAHDVSAAIRERVTAAAHDTIGGLTLAAVDVHVLDLLDDTPPDPGRGRRP